MSDDRNSHLIAGIASACFHACLILFWMTSAATGDAPSFGSNGPLVVEFVAIAHPTPAPDGLATMNRLPDQLLVTHIPAVQRLQIANQPSTDYSAQLEDPNTSPVRDTRRPGSNASEYLASVHGTGQSAAFPPSGDEDDLLARYHAAIRAKIESMWSGTTSATIPDDCVLSLELQAGGTLVSATASGCPMSDALRNQLEAAALMSQPLPYAGFESVFSEHLSLPMGR